MGGCQKSLQMVTAAMKLKDAFSLEKSYDQPRQRIKKQTHFFANKGPSSQSYGFSSSHVWTWELEYKESWPLKNWCFELWCWRKLLRVPWTSRKPSHSILKEISPKYLLKGSYFTFIPFLSVQSLSHVRLFTTPWTAAHQASLSIINSQRLFKLVSIKSVMPSNYLILYHPLQSFPASGSFQISSSHQVANVLEF